jgi:tRNA nucleotidyltransferase/poly(A) polymerase
MVLTRSQTRLLLEKDIIVTENKVKTKLDIVKFEKEFINNMNQMIQDFENKRNVTERMQYIIKILEYNNRMLLKFEPVTIKRLQRFIKVVYDKCLEFEREHLNGNYDKLQYKLVCDFLQIFRQCQGQCQELITNE